MIPEIKLLKLSVKIINRYEQVKSWENINSTELYNLFNVKPLEKSECNEENLSHIIENLRKSITHSDIIREFLDLLSYPVVYEGNVDKEGNIESLSVKTNTINGANIIREETKNTINKIIDGAVVLMQKKAFDEIICYFEEYKDMVDSSPQIKELANRFFFKNWNEIEIIWNKIYPKEYNEFDSVILDKMRFNFKKFRYELPRISILWNLYLLNESREYLGFDTKGNKCFSKNALDIIRPKYKASFCDKDAFTKNRIYKFKSFIRSFNSLESLSNEISKGINKSLCINFFNDSTKLIEAFLLSVNNEKMRLLRRRLNYNRDGKKAIRHVKRGRINFDKKVFRKEIQNIGQATIIGYTGLVYRFLCSKNKHDYDYNYNVLTLTALKYIYQYVYIIFDRYIEDNNLKSNIEIEGTEKEKRFFKYVQIFDEVGKIETDIECINYITDRLNKLKKFPEKENFFFAYEYLLNPVFLSKDRVLDVD